MVPGRHLFGPYRFHGVGRCAQEVTARKIAAGFDRGRAAFLEAEALMQDDGLESAVEILRGSSSGTPILKHCSCSLRRIFELGEYDDALRYASAAVKGNPPLRRPEIYLRK